jgi:hypothetical protein
MVMQEKMALILNNGTWEVVDLQVVHYSNSLEVYQQANCFNQAI